MNHQPKTWRLLPEDEGWVAYVWLVYLLNLPLVLFFMPDRAWLDWVWLSVAVAAFLPLYFVSFWVTGARLLAVVALIVVLAWIAVPLSPGSSVFFVYAAGAVGGFAKLKRGVGVLAGVFVATLLHALFAFLVLGWGLEGLLYVYAPPLIFVPVIGAVNLFYASQSQHNATLRLAQEEVERLAKVAERERIARDLHDLLGHTLSVITLKSELAAKLLARDVDKAAAEIRDVECISREALAEVRRAVRGYRAQGLAAELASAKVMLGAADIAFNYTLEPVTLTPEQENALAFALREAVTNVVRHSGATRCTVKLTGELTGNVTGRSADEDGVRLEVRDDGVGGAEGYREGSGLSGMRERLETVDGRLEHSTHTHNGTRLRVYLPYETESPSNSAEPELA